MAAVKLFLFGAPRIERDGLTVAVDTRKALALLAYLALTGQPQRRDALAALLWPEYDQTGARGALRRTLSTLNKALGGVGLAADRETVGLDSSVPLWSDIAAFQQLLADARAAAGSPERSDSITEPLAAAVALYHDDFMAGFSLRDSPAFDDWQGFQAESLRGATIFRSGISGSAGAAEPPARWRRMVGAEWRARFAALAIGRFE